MNSIVLHFEDSETVGKVIEKIKKSGTNLELAPMNFGQAGHSNPFNRLLVAGDSKEIADKLEMAVGEAWKNYVIQGEVVDDTAE